MAIHTVFEIDYICGHSEARDLSETAAGSRAGRAEWLSKQKCFECFKKANGRKLSKEFEASRSAELDAANAEAEKLELPTLEGSQKQIDWGVKVRNNLIRDAYAAQVESGQQPEDEFEAAVLAPARTVDRASWWIDNRAADVADLPELLAATGLSEGSSTENPY